MLALIVAVPAMLSPLLMAWLTNRNRRMEKQEDYKRQDDVAAKAEQVAQLLLDRQTEVSAATTKAAALLEVNTKAVSETAAATQTQLKTLTGMVDGNFTRLMEAELEAIAHGLVLSRQVAALTFTAGHEPTSESVAAILATEVKIAELREAIAERKHTASALFVSP